MTATVIQACHYFTLRKLVHSPFLSFPEVPVVVRNSREDQFASHYLQMRSLTVRSSTGELYYPLPIPGLHFLFFPPLFRRLFFLSMNPNNFPFSMSPIRLNLRPKFLTSLFSILFSKFPLFPQTLFPLLFQIRSFMFMTFFLHFAVCQFVDIEFRKQSVGLTSQMRNLLLSVSGDESQLKLRWFSLSKIHDIQGLAIKIEKGVNFLDVVVSSGDSMRVILLLSDGHAEVYENRVRIGKTGSTMGEVNG
jgi:hypothetical protein